MSEQQLETPAQAGRYLAMVHIFRAMIDIVADIADKPAPDIKQDIKQRTDLSTALFRLGGASDEKLRAAVAKMDLAITAILVDEIPERPN